MDGELRNKIFVENCVFQRGLILQVLSGRKLGIEAIRPNFLTRKLQYETRFTLLFSNVLTYKIRQSTKYYAGLLERWDKRIVDQEFDVPSIIFLYFLYT